MRLPRLLLSLLVIGLPVATVAVTAESASADPFAYKFISSDYRAVCAISTDDTLVCWGQNYNGNLIGRTTQDSYVPVPTRIPAPTGEKWTEADPGDSSTCGVTDAGHAYCWGEHGLGNYFTTTSRTPVKVEMPNDRRVHGLKNGPYTACAIENGNNKLWCWGDANYIGDGNTEPVRIPVNVALPDGGSVKVLDNFGGQVCVISSLDNMYCWGGNSNGEYGLGYSYRYGYSHSWTPVLVPAPTGTVWTSVSIGWGRICAIASDNNGYCAGDNYNGSFGDGTYDDSMRFVRMQVPGGESVAQVATTSYHTCIVTTSGLTWCVGEGSNGQLGSGTTLGGRTWRAPLLPDRAVVRTLALENPASCFHLTDGTIQCSGFATTSISYPVASALLRPSPLVPVGTPTVSAVVAGSIDAESVVLSGTINPNGADSTARIELSTTSDFTGARSVTIDRSFASGLSPVTWSVTLNDLAPRTTYRVRTLAVNDFGTTTGAVSQFTTLGTEPVTGTPTFSDITGNDATVDLTINPGRLATTARLEYSTDATFTAGIATINLPAFRGSADIAHQVVLGGLDPRTDHHVRVVAVNRLGTTVSATSVLHTVGDAPVVTLQSLTNTARTVSVQALVNPGLASGSVRAEISARPDFSVIAQSAYSSFGSRDQRVHSFDFAGLSPRTDYHVRMVATNGVGSDSVVRSLHTNGGAPSVSVPVVTPDVHGASVQVGFDANALSTLVKVLVSENADMSSATEHFIYAGDGEGAQSTFLNIGGLERGTDYWVVVSASNPDGIVRSTPVRFSTLLPIGIVVNDDDAETAGTGVRLTLTAPVGTVAVRLANNAMFRWARVFSPVTTLDWELAATSDDEDDPDTRTVYVEYIGANGSRSVYSDDITLLDNPGGNDVDAPVVTLARSSRVGAAAATIGTRSSRTVRVSVSDRRSGVNRVEVRANGRVTRTRVEPLRRAVYSIALPKGNGAAWVRVLDVAGHASKWVRLR